LQGSPTGLVAGARGDRVGAGAVVFRYLFNASADAVLIRVASISHRRMMRTRQSEGPGSGLK
jgi:hypothetical protein